MITDTGSPWTLPAMPMSPATRIRRQAPFPSRGTGLTSNGNYDVFVAKVNAEGTALDYCGYIGGSTKITAGASPWTGFGQRLCHRIHNSTEATFPVSVGPCSIQGGNFDAFVAKVNADGTALDYCGYIGGPLRGLRRGIAVDSSGHAYITGIHDSTEGPFPVVTGPDSDIIANGGFDAFRGQGQPAGRTLAIAAISAAAGERRRGPVSPWILRAAPMSRDIRTRPRRISCRRPGRA